LYIQVYGWLVSVELLSVQLTLTHQKINKDSPVPFYYQMVMILRELIQELDDDKADSSHHDQKPIRLSARFPSESELAEFFQVNRGTVRHALSVLEREGLIYREKGRGTFLRRRRVELDLMSLCSTTEDLQRRGWEPRSVLLELEQISPSTHIQRLLQLVEGNQTWKIYRLRLANDEPISLQWSYIPASLAPGLEQHDLRGSLYYTLKNQYNLTLKTADQTIRTRAATGEEAELLQINEGDALFEITRLTFDAEQRPVEYLDSLWRGDRYDLRVRLESAA